MRGAELHAGVDRLRLEAGALHEDDGAEEKGNSSRLTTKPAMSGTSTASLSSATQSAAARSRVLADVASGNASSTRRIFATGLKTCSPTKSSGRPEASASSETDSDDVVVKESRAARRPVELGEQRALQRGVLADRLDDERRVGERLEVADDADPSGSYSSPKRSHVLAICLRARSADASERAHRIGSPIRAAHTASPVAMAPLPAIPTCSSMTRPLTLIDWSVGTLSPDPDRRLRHERMRNRRRKRA